MKRGYQSITIAGGDTATPLNLQKRIRFLARVCDLRVVKFLDCGCGAGEYVFALRQAFGTDAWGIEYSEEKVRQARRHASQASRIKQGDIQHMDEPDGAYDVVLVNEVLEHVPDERAALREVNRILKPGGWLILISPNRWFPFETHGVYLRGTDLSLPPCVPFIPYLPLPVGSLFFRYWARNYWPHELWRLVGDTGIHPGGTGVYLADLREHIRQATAGDSVVCAGFAAAF